MRKKIFNSKKRLFLMALVAWFLFLLGTLCAGGTYLFGGGVKSQEAQNHFKKSTPSSASKKTSATEVQKESAPTSSEEKLVTEQNNPEVTTTVQENTGTTGGGSPCTEPYEYEAVYDGVVAYSTFSYDEALAIAKSLAQNQR